jgi:hypothetical protein
MGRNNEAMNHATQAYEASVVGDNVVVLQTEYVEDLMFIRVLLKVEKKTTKEPK